MIAMKRFLPSVSLLSLILSISSPLLAFDPDLDTASSSPRHASSVSLQETEFDVALIGKCVSSLFLQNDFAFLSQDKNRKWIEDLFRLPYEMFLQFFKDIDPLLLPLGDDRSRSVLHRKMVDILAEISLEKSREIGRTLKDYYDLKARDPSLKEELNNRLELFKFLSQKDLKEGVAFLEKLKTEGKGTHKISRPLASDLNPYRKYPVCPKEDTGVPLAQKLFTSSMSGEKKLQTIRFVLGLPYKYREHLVKLFGDVPEEFDFSKYKIFIDPRFCDDAKYDEGYFNKQILSLNGPLLLNFMKAYEFLKDHIREGNIPGLAEFLNMDQHQVVLENIPLFIPETAKSCENYRWALRELNCWFERGYGGNEAEFRRLILGIKDIFQPTWGLRTRIHILSGLTLYPQEERLKRIGYFQSNQRAHRDGDGRDLTSKEISDNFEFPKHLSALIELAKNSTSLEDRMNAVYCIFTKRPLKQQAAAFIIGGPDLYNFLLSWIPTFSPLIKEHICLNLIHILENHYVPEIVRIRAGHLLLKFGSPMQKNLGLSKLLNIAKNSEFQRTRTTAARIIFFDGTPEQKAEGFSVGGQYLYENLKSGLQIYSLAVKERICSDLTHILQNQVPADLMKSGGLIRKFRPSPEQKESFQNLTPAINQIRAGHLLLTFGTLAQKEESFSRLMDLAQNSRFLAERKNAACYIFRGGTLEQQAAGFTVGGIDLYNHLLFLIPTLSPKDKEQICSNLTNILQNNQLSAINRIRGGHLLLTFGTLAQKEASFSQLMDLAQNSISRADRTSAACMIFLNGTPKQKAEGFSVEGQDLYNYLLSFISMPSDKNKEKACSNLTYILHNKSSETAHLQVGHLLLIFGNQEQKKEAFLPFLVTLYKNHLRAQKVLLEKPSE